jgi:hypothetical protein
MFTLRSALPGHKAGQSHRRLALAGMAGFSAAILSLAALTLSLVPSRILCPWPLGIVEPSVLVGVERVVRGEALYRAYWESLPLNPLPYGVAEYLVPGLIGRWTGLVEPMELIRIGRLISLAAFLAVAILCMVAARGFGAGRLWSVAAAGGVFAVPAAMEWATKLAPDMPALALSLAGWLLARRLLMPGSPAGKFAAGVVCAVCWLAAFHYKPTVIAGPIALSVEMALLFAAGMRPWLPLAWSVVALGASLLVVVLLQWVTGGLYWANMFGSMAVCRYSLSNLAQTINLVPPNGVVLTGLLLVVVLRGGSHCIWLAALANFVLELLLATKQGSNVNYFMGSLALSGIAFAISASGTIVESRAMPGGRVDLRRMGLIAAHLVLLCGLILQVPGALEFSRELPIPDTAELAAADRTVEETGERGQVLCLDPFYARTRHMDYPYADSYHANLLLSAGIGDVSPLVGRARRREIPLIVANKLLVWKFAPHGAGLVYFPLREAVLQNYRPSFVGRWLILFVPESAPAGTALAAGGRRGAE